MIEMPGVNAILANLCFRYEPRFGVCGLSRQEDLPPRGANLPTDRWQPVNQSLWEGRGIANARTSGLSGGGECARPTDPQASFLR